MPEPPPGADVTAIVVSWQQRDLALAAVASLAQQSVRPQILLVDNGSTDGTAEAVAMAHPQVRVLRLADNRGFSGALAAALPLVHTRFVALLNNDAVADRHWLAASLPVLADPGVAAVTAKILLADRPGVVNNAGVVLLATGYGADRGLADPDDQRYAAPAEVFGFSGGAAVLRTMAVKAVGGFPADYFMYYEDTHVSWRLRLAGWSVRYCPDAVVRHRHGASSGLGSAFFARHTERNRLRMLLADAPAGFAMGCLLRFLVTTASLAARRLGGRRPAEPVFDVRLRLQVLADLARAAPAIARERRGAPRAVTRQVVLRRWRGTLAEPVTR